MANWSQTGNIRKHGNQSVKSPGSHKVNFTNEMRKSSFLTTIESAT